MLDFIVLGIVPGTNIVLTVRWVLLIALLFTLSALLLVEINKSRKTVDTKQVTDTTHQLA